jgi:hypothetical protein
VQHPADRFAGGGQAAQPGNVPPRVVVLVTASVVEGDARRVRAEQDRDRYQFDAKTIVRAGHLPYVRVACTASGGTWEGTSCTAPTPEATDPNGELCASLDSLGYCPGDDPSPMQQWCSGDGDSDFQAVQSDLDQLSTDSSNDDLISVESDGATLAQDAQTAVKNLAARRQDAEARLRSVHGLFGRSGTQAD